MTAKTLPTDGLAPGLGPIRWSQDVEMLPCRAGVQHIGIVFVHGVGFQAPGETLRAWIAPIIRMLRERARPNDKYLGQDPVRRAGTLSLAGESVPVVELRVPESQTLGKHRPQHWIVAEAFWADSIAPPDLGTVVSWLRQDGLAQAAGDLTVPNDAKIANSTAEPRKSPLIYASNRLLLSVFTSIFLLLYVALQAVFKVIPIPAIRDGVLAPMERLLTSWAGDMRVLLFDEAQSARVRTTLAVAVKALEASDCEDVVLIAHSGGAVASYMTLTDPQFADLPVRKLITFGQGLNIARRLLRAKSSPDLRTTEWRFFAPFDESQRNIAWKDFYATEDPVPNGPIPNDDLSSNPSPGDPDPNDVRHPGTSVSNRWSIRDDHGGYWDNDEEFVLPVLRHLDTPNAEPGDSRFGYARRSERTARRRQRVSALAMWRQLCFSGAAAAIFLGIIAQAWAHYVGQEARGQSPFAGVQGPLSSVWNSWEWTGLVNTGVGVLRETALWPLILIGTIIWPTLAAIATFNVIPQLSRWLQPWTGKFRFAVLIVAAISWAIILAGAVAISSMYASALAASPIWPQIEGSWNQLFDVAFTVTETIFGIVGQPAPIALVGMFAQFLLAAAAFALVILVYGALQLGWRIASRLGGVFEVAALLVAIVLLLLLFVCAIYALVVSATYGWYILTLLLATVPFFLLNFVAEWRWRAWDEQERWEFRNRARRPLGRAWDSALWVWLVLAGGGLVIWVGVSQYSPEWSTVGLTAALVFVFLILLVGAIQDARNVRGTAIGMEPDYDETQFETAKPAPQAVPPA